MTDPCKKCPYFDSDFGCLIPDDLECPDNGKEHNDD